MIAILIKTYNKNLALINTLRSIEKHCRVPYRLYIHDDGETTEEKEHVYASLRAEGHFVEVSSEQWAVTKARNYLLSKLADEKFVLRIDDDFEFVPGTNITLMIGILESNPEISVLAGIERQVGESKGVRSMEMSNGQGLFTIRDEKLIKTNIPVPKWRYVESTNGRFAFCDHSRNFLMIKRNVLDIVKWDENIFFTSEHIDFMLSLKKANCKLAFTPDSVHHHRDDLSEQDKLLFNGGNTERRGQKKVSEAYLQKKWGFREIVQYVPFHLRPVKSLMEIFGIFPALDKQRFHV
jgi:GT2 family glycosyltransferase